MAASGPGAMTVYDSAEEIEKELRTAQTPRRPIRPRVISKKRIPEPGVNFYSKPTSALRSPPPRHASGEEEAVSNKGAHPATPAAATPTTSFAPPTAAAAPPSSAPVALDPIPTSLVWQTKVDIVGAVVMISESLARTGGDEFTDRIAWICLQRLIDGRRFWQARGGLREDGGGGGGGGGKGSAGDEESEDVVVPKLSSLKLLQLLKRHVSELRSSHGTFLVSVRQDLFHGALLILMRVLSLALMSAELVVEPFAWVAEKHVQEMVFLCDFTKVILDVLPAPVAPSHPSSLPAHYANETFVRMLPIKDSAEGMRHTEISALAKSLSDQATVVTNAWLRKNLTRVATGYRMLGLNDFNPSKTLSTIEKERSEAVLAWGKANGMDKMAIFSDVMFLL